MKYSTVVFVLVLAFGQHASAQRHKIGTVNAETPEGALLQQIGQESDEAKKIPRLEKSTAKFRKQEATGWWYTQLQALY